MDAQQLTMEQNGFIVHCVELVELDCAEKDQYECSEYPKNTMKWQK